MHDDDPTRPGLMASVKPLADHALGLLLSRSALAALELAEARDALLRLLLLSACGLLAATFALVLWSALLIVLTWEAMGWTILLWLAAAYSLLAWLLLRQVRRLLGSAQLGLPATMAELRADRDALFDRAS